MILVGERHLHGVLKKIEQHHNAHRTHQGIGNAVPMGFDYPKHPATPDRVICEPSLDGLLNHYHIQQAA